MSVRPAPDGSVRSREAWPDGPAVVIALGLVILALPASVEGPPLLPIGPGHALSLVDAAGVLPLAGGSSLAARRALATTDTPRRMVAEAAGGGGRADVFSRSGPGTAAGVRVLGVLLVVGCRRGAVRNRQCRGRAGRQVGPCGRCLMLRVGVISDTHGLLRPEAMAFLAGSDHIVHAGDVGDPAILDALAAVAPLTAIRGNVDTDAWASRLPETTRVTISGVTIYVLHDLGGPRPEAARTRHPRRRLRPLAQAVGGRARRRPLRESWQRRPATLQPADHGCGAAHRRRNRHGEDPDAPR